MIGVCKLCRSESELRLSHIIPKFVYSWLKDTAASPIRDSRKPNIRVQDGEKTYFLCADCEKLFSKWEKLFAQNIFLPLQKERHDKRYHQYGEWCLKFAVSISWRILAYDKERGLEQTSIEHTKKADEALEIWREYLLAIRKSPAPFDQHLLPLSLVSGFSDTNLSPFINRYFLRAIDIAIAYSNNRMFTYAKMGKLILFGLIREDYPNQWKGGKIMVDRGIISLGTSYRFPPGLDAYLSERANKVANMFGSMSPNQQNKVQQYAKDNEGKIIESEMFTAMKQDFELFGDDAVKV